MAEIIEVRIETIAYGGDGLGRVDGRAVFVPGTAPGDVASVRVVERKKNYLRGEPVAIVSASPDRREPPCPLVGRCGGCQLQHLEYGAQLAAKSRFVRDAIERIGHIHLDSEVPILGDREHELGYRIRATAHLAHTRDGVVFGFFGPRSHRVIDVPTCPLLVPELDEAWKIARGSSDALHRVDQLELACGDDRASAEPPIAAIGGAQLETGVGEYRYRFTPSTFFQANRFLLEPLVTAAIGHSGSGDLAVDLFAGVGLFAIPLSRSFSRVVAVESDARSAGLARENALANAAPTVEVVEETVEQWLEGAVGREIDMALLDPPRTGLGLEASQRLAEIGPRRVVYVSCDPTTLARDMRILVDGGYSLESLEAFDLFPQTFHVRPLRRSRARSFRPLSASLARRRVCR